MITHVAIGLVLGLLASLVIQQILRHLLGIRANWLLTLIASELTSGVFALVFVLGAQGFDPKASFYLAKVLGCSVGAATLAGLVGFRFNIHGSEGDHPSWPAALALTVLVVAPTFIILTLLHLVSV
jgi:hypothetical protein